MQNDRSKLYNYADGEQFIGKSTEEIFSEIAKNNTWLEKESVSGIGSSLHQTTEIIEQLPNILQQFNIKTLLDLPCGDFNWMQKVGLKNIQYTGADIVAELIIANNQKYANENITFIHLDLLTDRFNKYDLIFCRDCLVHLSFQDIFKAFANIKKSNSIYVMTTTFTDQESNEDIPTGGWRPLNLEKSPFHFPKPLYLLNEKCTEMNGAFHDKSLGIWKITDCL